MHPGMPLAYAARHIYAPNEDPYRVSRAQATSKQRRSAGARQRSCCRDARASPCSIAVRPQAADHARHVPREVASRGRCTS